MKKRAYRIAISAVIFILAILNPIDNKILRTGLFFAAYIIIAYEVIRKAFKNLFSGSLMDENFLMTVASLGAFIIGEYPEAVAVMLFYEIGEYFQAYAVENSRKSIAEAMNIVPEYANVYREGDWQQVDPDEVLIGEKILIKAGERVPLDGIVLDGHGTIDTSALTGESVPREVEAGAEILSGCINMNSVITVEVKKDYESSTVNTILNFVEDSLTKKSKQERFISRFARYYTPIVVFSALALAFLPPLLIAGQTLSNWVYRALIFLVVSCPCALVVSVPLTFVGAMGGASRKGILVKGANYLEALAKADTAVFDKTGTLTKGTFELKQIKGQAVSDDELLELAAYAESFSDHPIGQSVIKAYEKKGGSIDNSRISQAKEIAGRGVSVLLDGAELLAGNSKLMKEHNIEFEAMHEVGTHIYVAYKGKFLGSLLIADTIKEDAPHAMEDLHQEGFKRLILLTGDSKEVAAEVSHKLGLTDFRAELLPSDKVIEFEKIIENSDGKAIFVGDGINDAPVIARADVGIAMGAFGSDAAIEAADIVIMTDEPSKIAQAVRISKKANFIAKQNTFFAIAVKMLVLILASFGLSSMWAAIFADVGVTVLAILNAFRTMSVKNPVINLKTHTKDISANGIANTKESVRG